NNLHPSQGRDSSSPTRVHRMGPLSSLDVFLALGGFWFLVLGSWFLEQPQAGMRLGSSTIEKRTPALCRFSSETARQASSASLRVENGPWTWAEPCTSVWKFIEPNSPPITQKLLPFVMLVSCC